MIHKKSLNGFCFLDGSKPSKREWNIITASVYEQKENEKDAERDLKLGQKMDKSAQTQCQQSAKKAY